MTSRVLRHLAAILAVALLALGNGCGGGDDEPTTSAPPPASAPSAATAPTPSAPTAPAPPTETALPPDTTGSVPSAPPGTAPTTPSSSDVQAYQAEGNRICAAAKVRSQALAGEIIQSGGMPSEDLIQRLIDGTEQVGQELAAVTPPEELADGHERMVETYGATVERLRELFEEEGANILSVAGQDQELMQIGTRLAQSWQELGLSECAG